MIEAHESKIYIRIHNMLNSIPRYLGCPCLVGHIFSSCLAFVKAPHLPLKLTYKLPLHSHLWSLQSNRIDRSSTCGSVSQKNNALGTMLAICSIKGNKKHNHNSSWSPFSLRFEDPKFEFRCIHPRTNWDHHNSHFPEVSTGDTY